MTCSVKWLKAVDDNPVGRVVTGVERDELIDKWEAAGLIAVTDDDPADETGPNQAEKAPLAVYEDAPAPTVVAPPASARKGVWRDFLESQGIVVDESATKQTMIEAWEEEQAGG